MAGKVVKFLPSFRVRVISIFATGTGVISLSLSLCDYDLPERCANSVSFKLFDMPANGLSQPHWGQNVAPKAPSNVFCAAILAFWCPVPRFDSAK